MDSNYVSLGNYYKNQNNLKEKFAQYNVGKFELEVVNKDTGIFKVVNSDLGSNNMELMNKSPSVTINLPGIPVGQEIKSIDFFTIDPIKKYILPTAFPIGASQNVHYDPALQQLSFNNRTTGSLLKTLNVQNINTLQNTNVFARIYVTW
jgi:hypothetical protein